MKNRWYDCSVEEIVEKLNSNVQSGLTQKQALAKLRSSGRNIIYPISKASFKSYLWQVVTDLTAILLFVAAAAAALFEKNACAVAILAILTVNYTVSIVSFIRSQRILEDAAGQSLPNAKVIRDGKLYLVRQEELVRGDIILVCAGDIVPCDARIIECEGLTLLESNLYDAKGPIQKRADFMDARNLPMRDRVNMLYASTIVTSGRGKAIVCETGASTLVCELKKNPSIANHDKLSIIARLQRYSTVASLLSIGLVFLLTLLNFCIASGRDIFDVFLITLSYAVSSMSELYTAFAYIIISLGIFGAVRQFHKVNTGAVIKNASSIEKMKKIDCLFIPKESLFIEKEMKLSSVYTQGILYSVFDPRPTQAMCETLRYAVISSGLYGAGRLVNDNIKSNNVYSSEEEAILRAARQCTLYDKRLDSEYPMIEHIGYGRDSRFDTTLFRHDGQFKIALRGDIRHVLANCTSYRKDAGTAVMTGAKKSEILYEADRMMREHYKVIAIATKDSVYNNLRRLPACQNDLTFEGFLCIQEPILPDAAKCVARCRNAGIRVIMFTSDISEANRSLASSLGIIKNPEEAVSIAQLSQMRDDLIRTNLSVYHLYEGLNNAQLRHIMHWLKEDLGYEIGVLGRTLDDVGLIRDADVGFAEVLTLSGSASKGGVEFTPENMPVLSKNPKDSGKNGCEALKFISDVAVSKPDRQGNGGFNAVVAAITSSKAIYLNIFRTVCYLLMTNSARLFLVLLATFTDILLIQPHQMLFGGLIVDLLAVFVFAFTRPDPLCLVDNTDYEKKLTLLPIRQFPIWLIGFAWGGFSFLTAELMRWLCPNTTDLEIFTLVFISFTICQLFVLFSISNPSFFKRKGVRINVFYIVTVLICLSFILLCFGVNTFGSFFSMERFSGIGYVLMFIPMLGTVTMFELYKLLRDRDKKKKPTK